MGGSTPTAYGAEWGDVFVGVSYHERARFARKSDGSIGAGFGIGDAQAWVGLEVLAISFSTARSGFTERAGIDFKLHRALPRGFSAAIGWESALLRGVTDGRRSKYAVLSQWIDLRGDTRAPFSSLVLSAGIGNGRFRSRESLLDRKKSLGYFGSVALRVLEPVSVVANWTGQDVVLLTSIAPFERFGAVINLGVLDFTGRIGDGTRYLIAGSYSHSF
jgi:hypothetical protein